jgi:hypothetical protein
LQKLETWTVKQFKWNMKAPNDASTRFLYDEFNLKQLTQLNYTLYTNTDVSIEGWKVALSLLPC